MGDVLQIKRFTICTECKHLEIRDGAPVWYSSFCRASPNPIRRDPFDGKEKPYSVNDLGGDHSTDEKLKHCRSVNTDGNCSKFEPGP